MYFAFSQLLILIRSRLISFHMLYTTPRIAGIALHATSSPHFTADAFRLVFEKKTCVFHRSLCAPITACCVCHTLVLRVSTFLPFHYHRERSFSIDQAGGRSVFR